MLSISVPSKVFKTLILQDESRQKVKILPLQLPTCDDKLSFRELFYEIMPDLSSKIIKIYDFINDSFTNLTPTTYLFPINNLHPSNLVIIKITTPDLSQISSNPSTITSHNQAEEKSETSSHKKQRSKERVIFEVIEIVKRWREIHQSKNHLKKMSLQEAAKIVGLPKKSLDDYYYQLRLGQKYDFDFRAHLFDRVGVLRTYLKNLKESYKLDKNQKHPKKLKIIDEFEQISELFHRNKQEKYRDFQEMEEQCEEDFQNMKMEHDINEQESKGIQSQFYNQFEYLMNEKDPFLACDYNFKKKGVDQGDSGDFFF